MVFLLARLLAAVAVATALAVLGLAAARLALDLPIANWPAAVAFVLAGAAIWYLVMLNLQILAGAENRGEILTSFVIFPSMMLGGAMFPFGMMPDSIAAIGKATPLGWMTFRFDSILRGQATAGQVAVWLVILAVATLLLFSLSGWHLRRKFLRG
jgi:ABC-type multidrug transport system permease subunit